METNLGLIGTEEHPNPAGIGYVVIPSNIERSLYIKSVYKNNAIMVRNEDGNLFRNVSVVADVLESLKFPKTSEGFGSMVIFINVPKYNKKVVVGLIDMLGSASRILSENQYKLEQISEKFLTSLMLDADGGEMNISVSSFVKGNKSKVNFTVTNPDKDSEMNVYVSGNIKLHASNEVKLISNDTLTFAVEDNKSKQLFNFKYKKSEGLTITDEFGNEIKTNESLVSIFSNKSKKYVEFNNKTLELGTKDKEKQESVLGQSLKTILEEFISILKAAKTNTSIGPQPFMPASQLKLENLKKKLDTILSKSVKLD